MFEDVSMATGCDEESSIIMTACRRLAPAVTPRLTFRLTSSGVEGDGNVNAGRGSAVAVAEGRWTLDSGGGGS
jgi:hypothetical protein